MVSSEMMYIPSLMTIGSDIQVILRLLPQQSERLQYWYYWWEEFIKYADEMASCSGIYIPNFMKNGRHSSIITVLPQQFKRLHVGINYGRDLLSMPLR
jgi:hypothetical protein